MTSQPAMSGPLEDMAATLGRALELVTKCQAKQNIVGRIIKAGEMASQLRRVRDDMSDKVMLVILTTTVQITVNIEEFRNSVGRLSGEGEASVSHPVGDSNIRLEAINGEVERLRHLRFLCFRQIYTLWNLDAYVDYSQKQGSISFTKFSLSELETAAHKFSDDNLVGQGAFAAVYKGVLRDGRVVVIKKVQRQDKYHEEEICKKIELVSKLKHKNMVELLGYGHKVHDKFGEDRDVRHHEDYVFLVEEYMANGSLGNIIYGSQLDWSSRLRLIQGIAHGLQYLHEQQIVHLDLIPDNVLLDSDMNPKITDSGRAIMLDQYDNS